LETPTDSELRPPLGFENRGFVDLGANVSPKAFQSDDDQLEDGEALASKVAVITSPPELQPTAVQFIDAPKEDPKNTGIKRQTRACIGKGKSANQQPQGSRVIIANGQTSLVSSMRTSDSIQKLAEEALHIGELLGIKVVQNEKAAASRITEP